MLRFFIIIRNINILKPNSYAFINRVLRGKPDVMRPATSTRRSTEGYVCQTNLTGCGAADSVGTEGNPDADRSADTVRSALVRKVNKSKYSLINTVV
jgi:hypothetical protein